MCYRDFKKEDNLQLSIFLGLDHNYCVYVRMGGGMDLVLHIYINIYGMYSLTDLYVFMLVACGVPFLGLISESIVKYAYFMIWLVGRSN